jgi:hypothetical protein
MNPLKIALIGMGALGVWVSHPSSLRSEEPYWKRELSSEESRSLKSSIKGFPVSLESIPKVWLEPIHKVMAQPTLVTSAGPERFFINDEMYQWLLNHPDRVALAWRRSGVPALDIQDEKNGWFSWKDGEGTELSWITVAKSDKGRIWFAEGKVRPGPLLPVIPVRAVAILRHETFTNAKGRISVRHQVDAFLQTDSKFAALVMRILGPTAPKLAEQGADQLLYFFSGIGKLVDADPDKAPILLSERKRR